MLVDCRAARNAFVLASVVASFAAQAALSGASLTFDIPGLADPLVRDPVEAAYDYSESGTLPGGAAYSFSINGSANLADGVVKGKAHSTKSNIVSFTNTIFDEFTFFGEPGTSAHVGFVFHVDATGDLDDIGDSNREYQLDATVSAMVLTTSIRDTSVYHHRWGLYTFNLGGSEIYESVPTGDVDVINAEKGSFEAEVRTWLDVPIGASGASAPVLAQWILQGHASSARDFGSGFAIVDASNTAHAGLVVPAGYTYTSASGVFLSAPVPEPSTWSLFAAALLAMGWRAARAQAVQAS